MNKVSFPYSLRDDEQLFFLHIPKTAGSTFRCVLEEQFKPHEICRVYALPGLVALPASVLAGYKLIAGHLPYNIYQILPRKPVYTTMLRDPIEQTISWYEHVRRMPKHGLYTKANTLSLADFLKDLNGVRAGVTNYSTSLIGYDFDVRGVRSFHQLEMSDKSFRQPDIALACERLSQFTFIGLTERFQDSLDLLSYTFGWEPITNYQSHNVAPGRIRAEELPQATVDLIKEINRPDLQLYAYGKELFEERFAQMMRASIEQHNDRHAPVLKRPSRSQQVDQLRDVLRVALPPNAAVLVVSKGDEDLLQLAGPHAAHFPQVAGGTYAGHHPATSAEAITHLEELRAGGAEYLLIPQTSLWWLEHYAEFARHLDTSYARLHSDEHCVIYKLS